MSGAAQRPSGVKNDTNTLVYGPEYSTNNYLDTGNNICNP